MIDNKEHKANEIGKYLSGNCSNEEVDALMRWRDENKENLALFEEMNSVWNITQPSDLLREIDLDAQWGKIEPQIGVQQRARIMQRKIYRMVAAAAAVGLLLFVVYSQSEKLVESSNQPVFVSAMQPDANELVILPDGSKVWLRKGGEISYDQGFSPRSITLKGEGFFEVTSDREHPFTVRMEEAFVRVIGTKFNLRETDSGDVELFVEEGKVAFGQEDKPADQSVFTRDQVAVFRVSTLVVERIANKDVNRLSWKTGSLMFDNASLGDVLSDLERHYQVEFEVADDEMLNCDLKADFENSGIEEVVSTIEFIMSWDIEYKNEVYMISGNPCKSQEK